MSPADSETESIGRGRWFGGNYSFQVIVGHLFGAGGPTQNYIKSGRRK